MKCPYCNGELERGELKSRGGLFFLPDGESMPMLYTDRQMEKHRAIPLLTNVTSLTSEGQAACVCRECRKIIIDY